MYAKHNSSVELALFCLALKPEDVMKRIIQRVEHVLQFL
jgi:hypothetical protein